MGECKISKICFNKKPFCCGECIMLNDCYNPCFYMDTDNKGNPKECDNYAEVQ